METNIKLCLCDLDGTLASTQWRDHLVEGDKKQYPEYYKGIPFDSVVPKVMSMLKDQENQGNKIVYITAREESLLETRKRNGTENKEILPIRKWTEGWLTKHGAPDGLLLMRKSKDHRTSSAVKEEMLNKLGGNKTNNIVLALDDNEHVIEMYKRRGIANAILVTDPGIAPHLSQQHDKFIQNLPVARLLIKAAQIIDAE